MSVNDIAKKVGINRLTASKYLAILQARGIVILARSVGRAKMFQLSPSYAESLTNVGGKKRRKKVEILKKWLHYEVGMKVFLEEDQALELIRAGYARECTE